MNSVNNKISPEFIEYVSNVFADTTSGLSNSGIDKILSKYSSKYDVNLPKSEKMLKKSDRLRMGMSVFNGKQQFEMIEELCNMSLFKKSTEVKDVYSTLKQKYSQFSNSEFTTSEIVVTTQHWLEGYVKSKKLYDSALNKIKEKIFERNALDDMRLSFELLMKEILRNDKPLEKNISIIGDALSEKQVNSHFRNMITTIITYYTKYQNDFIKHNDRVNEDELLFVVELTSILMKFVIVKLGDNANGQIEI